MSFWKKDKEKEGVDVAVSLKKVLADISAAVQNANFILDKLFAETYLTQGYEKKVKDASENASDNSSSNAPENTPEELIPITFSLDLPSEGPETMAQGGGKSQNIKQLSVPATSLLHHNSMQLDEVDLTLRFTLNSRKDDDLLIDLRPEPPVKTDNISEMKMHFKCREAPEGMARLEMRHYQGL